MIITTLPLRELVKLPNVIGYKTDDNNIHFMWSIKTMVIKINEKELKIDIADYDNLCLNQLIQILTFVFL